MGELINWRLSNRVSEKVSKSLKAVHRFGDMFKSGELCDEWNEFDLNHYAIWMIVFN